MYLSLTKIGPDQISLVKLKHLDYSIDSACMHVYVTSDWIRILRSAQAPDFHTGV